MTVDNVTVKVDEQLLNDVRNRLGDLSSKKANIVIYRSLNRAMTTVAARVSQEVRKDYNIKAGDIKATLEKTRATRTNLAAIVKSKGEPVPLDRFKLTPRKAQPKRKKPIKVGVKKDGMKEILHAFVADINGIKVFKRKGKSRLPIKRLFGPSIPQMIGNEEVRLKINKAGQEMFYKRLDHEIEQILNKGAG